MEYEIIPYDKLIAKIVEFSNSLFPLKLGKEITKQHTIILSHGINTQTICSIRLLVIEKHANDIAVLSRSMFESVIDMGTIASGKINNDIERFQGFSDVENFRLYSHMVEINPQLTRRMEIKKKITLKESKNKMLIYKTKFHNINSWCGLTLLERCRLIDNYCFPTGADKKFYEFLYYQVFRICSCSTHRTYLGLSSAKLKKENNKSEGPWIFDTNIERLLHVCRYAIFVYLSSLRFLGEVFKIEQCESYYHSMSQRLLKGRIARREQDVSIK